jgi:hypothetical protein
MDGFNCECGRWHDYPRVLDESCPLLVGLTGVEKTLCKLLILRRKQDATNAECKKIWLEEMKPLYDKCSTMEEFQVVSANFQLTDEDGSILEAPGRIPLSRCFVVDRIRHGNNEFAD